MRKFLVKSGNYIIKPQDENNAWECDWDICLKKEGTKIGITNFKGEKIYGTIPLYVELEPEYRDKKIGRRVVQMMTNWAFEYVNIFEVTVSVDAENDMAIKSLEHCDYILREDGKVTKVYSITKPKSVWTGAYVVLGTIMGVVGGFLFGNAIIGFAVGIALSVIVGAGLDLREKKYRESVTGKSESLRSKKNR